LLYVPALKKIMNVRFGATSALLVRHIGRLRHCWLRRTGGLVNAMLGTREDDRRRLGLCGEGNCQAVGPDQADLGIRHFDNAAVCDPAEGSSPRAHHRHGIPHI